MKLLTGLPVWELMSDPAAVRQMITRKAKVLADADAVLAAGVIVAAVSLCSGGVPESLVVPAPAVL